MLKGEKHYSTKTLKHLLVGCIILSIHYNTFGQLTATGDEHKIDSLINLIHTSNEDTAKVQNLNSLGFEYCVSNFARAKFYLNKAEELARKIKFKVGLANSLSYLGIAYETQGDYFEALNAQLQALKIREEIGDKSGIAYSIHYIGDIYFGQSDLTEKSSAKEEYNKKALEQYFKALKIAEEVQDIKSIANTYNCIGNSYREQDQVESALDFYDKAVKIRESIGDQINLSTTYVNLGKLYLRQEKYTEALTYLFKALKLSEELGHKRTHVKALGTIASIYFKQKQYDKSIEFCNKSLALGRAIGYLEYIAKAHKLLSQIYSTADYIGHNGDKAFTFYKEYIAERDSIDSKKANQVELQIDFDKKQELAQAEQEKKDALAKEELKRKEQERNYLIVGFALLGLLTALIFRSYRQKQKANRVIASKNQEITDSITYALRIQQAKLPKKEEIYSALPNSFVLFKPKDIVSGDFYYFQKHEELLFIAAADCTGHGVPGAFMSMICSEKLDEVIRYRQEPSAILQQLNKGIKSSLHQSESDDSTRDGMDIALCCINTRNGLVQFAGANRPLWIIRKDKDVLEEIKATKSAIGGLTDDQQFFETHQVQLQTGDTFYICTDGYADQFGEKDGKKLMTKKFKALLLSIQDKSLREQERHLETFIDDWKGKGEQIDDILVIGVRM